MEVDSGGEGEREGEWRVRGGEGKRGRGSIFHILGLVYEEKQHEEEAFLSKRILKELHEYV